MHTIPQESMVFLIFVVFTGAAFFSTVALYTRQSMLVAYMLLGFLVGPYEWQLIPNAHMVSEIGEIGIIFLLFLLGLHMQPKSLVNLLRSTLVVTVGSSIIFAGLSYITTYFFGYTTVESIIIGTAILFSSTIIGLKLLPTTVLHHRHTGELMISILLLQDLLAIIALLVIRSVDEHDSGLHEALTILLGLPGLIIIAFLFERYVLMSLLRRFNHIKEYIFLSSIGWCLSIVVLGKFLGLSPEIGAFIAGVTLAEHPISQYIAESLKPLRDFFLIAFFFSIGATFDPHFLTEVIVPASILALMILLLKPVVFRFLLTSKQEENSVAWEVSWRLGQASEFSLLIAYLATNNHLISLKASYLIQAATILTFIVSSYFIVLYYPSPLALTERLRRD